LLAAGVLLSEELAEKLRIDSLRIFAFPASSTSLRSLFLVLSSPPTTASPPHLQRPSFLWFSAASG
jgi:hypothetical protein